VQKILDLFLLGIGVRDWVLEYVTPITFWSRSRCRKVGALASEGWWRAWQPSQGNKELLVVKDKLGDPTELRVNKVHGMW